MTGIKGFYTDDDKRKRPITGRISKAGDAGKENTARKDLVRQRKFKSMPAKDTAFGEFSIRNFKKIHPVFYPYLMKNYKATGNIMPHDHYYTVEPGDKPGEKVKIVEVWRNGDRYDVELADYQIRRFETGDIYDFQTKTREPKDVLKNAQEKGDNESMDRLAKAYAKMQLQLAWEGSSYENKEKYEAMPIIKSEDGKGYTIAQVMDAQDAFLWDVERGKVKDENGLKLSLNQVRGLAPEGSFLHSFEKKVFSGTDAYDNRDKMDQIEKRGYYVGLVVKLQGHFDPELSNYNNHYAVITNVLDNYHFEVVTEGYKNAGRTKLVVRDSDVKGWMGDYKETFRGNPAIVQGFAEEIMRSTTTDP